MGVSGMGDPFIRASRRAVRSSAPIHVKCQSSGRRFDTPYISRLIQRQPYQPELLILSNGNTVHDSRTDAGFDGKTLQLNCRPDFQRTTEPNCTSLWVYQERHTRLEKGMSRIHAGNNNRNLETDSSAAPGVLLLWGRTH